MKKPIKKRITYFVVILILIVGLAAIILINNKFVEFRNQGLSLFSLEGYKEIEVGVQNNAIILKENCRAIIVNVPEEMAHNVWVAKYNKTEERPSIYDSTNEIINYFDIELRYIKIEKLENNIFYSKVVFSIKDKVLNLDMRPSNAIILAIKSNKPIYINNFLLENYGVNIC